MGGIQDATYNKQIMNEFSMFFPATNLGESFNAELIKLEADVVVTVPGEEEKHKKYNLIIKFLSHDPMNREMVKKCGYHIREYKMYSCIIPELNDYWRKNSGPNDQDYTLKVPEYVYGVCNSSEYVVVLQNCKTFGFVGNNKQLGLCYPQLMMAVDHIARLHALSYSYSKYTKFLEKYPCIGLMKMAHETLKSMVCVSLDNVIRFLRTIPERSSQLAKLEKGRRTLGPKFEAIWQDESRHKLLCLAHGDFWNSNLLFKYPEGASDDGKHLSFLSCI